MKETVCWSKLPLQKNNLARRLLEPAGVAGKIS